MPTVSGVIDVVSGKGNSFQMNGEWYSVFSPADMCAVRGDSVTFDFEKKGQWNNIKLPRGAKLYADGQSTPSTPVAGAAPAARPQGRSFPVAPLAPERTINRQNALTAAVNALTQLTKVYGTTDELAVDVIALAYKFENYTTGDDVTDMLKDDA